jgi:hypothetical protein
VNFKEIRIKSEINPTSESADRNVDVVYKTAGSIVAAVGIRHPSFDTGDTLVTTDIPMADAEKIKEEEQKSETTTRDKYIIPIPGENNTYMLRNRSYIEKEQLRGKRIMRYPKLITNALIEEHFT